MKFPSPRHSRWTVVVVALLLGALVRLPVYGAGSKKRDPGIAVRFHSQVDGYDPTFAAKVRVGNPPKEITVEKIPSLSERDITSFYPYRAADGSFSAVFKLDRHGEATLESISTEKRGTFLVAVVNGRPVTSLLIDRTIKDGIIFIPSGLTEADIRALGASFSILGQPATGKNARRVPYSVNGGQTSTPDLPAQ